MQQKFSEGLYADGLADGVRMAGEKLREHFPRSKDDVNELTDAISFDNNETGS
jgi:uncharacterized membrane protein